MQWEENTTFSLSLLRNAAVINNSCNAQGLDWSYIAHSLSNGNTLQWRLLKCNDSYDPFLTTHRSDFFDVIDEKRLKYILSKHDLLK